MISGCEFALVGEDDEEQEEGQVDGELHGQVGGGGGEGRGASWLLRGPPSLHLDCGLIGDFFATARESSESCPKSET